MTTSRRAITAASRAVVAARTEAIFRASGPFRQGHSSSTVAGMAMPSSRCSPFSPIRPLDHWMVIQDREPSTSFAWQPEAWPEGWLVRQHRLHRRTEGFGAGR